MMFQAGWKIEETEVRQLIVDSQTLIDVFDCESADVIVTNVSGRLSSLRPRLRSFLRDMYRHVSTEKDSRISCVCPHDQL